MHKIALIGGGGVRTPLVVHGFARAKDTLNITELVLYDIDRDRLEVIAKLAREIVRRWDAGIEIRIATDLEAAVEGASFVINSVRVGGMAARARDERIAIDNGLAGQETTGPGGAAMALRTLPVTLAHARVVERVAPKAWFINFTNPAGLITQALTQQTALKVIGICDTPIELFHHIATSLGEPYEEMTFDYAGLNHLGWVRRVTLRGQDVTGRALEAFSSDLFESALIRALRLIPSEYVFFYYSQQRARENQLRAGASRGEELECLNRTLFDQLAIQAPADALSTYRDYLLRRNASYMKLEAQGGSAFNTTPQNYDPFETATGYHRIALDVMEALVSDRSRKIVLNVSNRGAIEDLEPDDIVEVPCDVDCNGPRAHRTGRLPESVRGLVQAVKAYESTLIRAALEGSASLARLALLEYPIIGQWEIGTRVLESLRSADQEYLGYLK